MSRLRLSLVIGLLFISWVLGAQEKGFGLGVIVGEPTGISVKAWMGRGGAICAAAGWSLTETEYINFHGDYIFHNFSLINVEKGSLPVYYGVGIRIKTKGETKFGVRIPVGIDYLLDNAPLDIFFEIVPVLDLTPETKFRFSAGLGIRFFFG